MKREFYIAYVTCLEVDGKVNNFLLFQKVRKKLVQKWVCSKCDAPLVISIGAIPYAEVVNGQLPVHLASRVCWTPYLPSVEKARFEEEVLQKL